MLVSITFYMGAINVDRPDLEWLNQLGSLRLTGIEGWAISVWYRLPWGEGLRALRCSSVVGVLIEMSFEQEVVHEYLLSEPWRLFIPAQLLGRKLSG